MAKNTQFPYLSILRGLVNNKIPYNNQMGYINGLRRWTMRINYFFDPWTSFFRNTLEGIGGDGDDGFQLRKIQSTMAGQ